MPPPVRAPPGAQYYATEFLFVLGQYLQSNEVFVLRSSFRCYASLEELHEDARAAGLMSRMLERSCPGLMIDRRKAVADYLF